ncbi:MAG: hypothetical protein K2L27_05995 [Muribaculaceae bacterium]|nr:hypothetical protein [Muribaculaceae bacterium]
MTAKKALKPYPLWRRIVKILLWTAMAAVLLIAGTLICAVSILKPERLTPIALKAANRHLEADVDASRMELGLRATFPFLTLRVDSLTIVSRAMRALPAGQRAGLPAYADTLLSLRSLEGGISLAALAKGEIQLSDIVVDGAGINIVTAADGTCNYAITAPTAEEADTTATELPRLSIRRFAITSPRPVRYFDASAPAGPDSIVVLLKPASLTDKGHPLYRLEFGGNLHMPMLGDFNLAQLPFAVDGDLSWDPARPQRLLLDNFSASAAFVSSRLSADIDLADPLTLHALELSVDPVRIDTLLACIPDSLARTIPALRGLHTDGTAALAIRLNRPFDTAADSIPYADINLDIAPCSLSMGRSRMHDVEMRVRAELRGNDPAAAILHIDRLHAAGPATDLTLTGTVSQFGDDPYVDARLQGHSDLARLPDALLDLVEGSLRGRLNADFSLRGRPSMFSRDGFHNLMARGSLSGDGLYWLSDDTVRAAYVRHVAFSFGTGERLRAADGTVADSLLQASVRVDSASYLDHDVSVQTGGLTLGAGASNRRLSADTTEIIPMGGGLKIAYLRVQSIADSAGVIGRDLNGRVTMKRFHGESRRPQFDLSLHAGRLAAGSPDMRFLLTEANIAASAHMLPPTKRQAAVKRTADSLRVAHPELPLDSVYALAIAAHRRTPHRPRVHTETGPGDIEIMDWGTSTGLRRLLTRWQLSGRIDAKRAGLYTPAFPLRNRVRNFNLEFSTDSVRLNNVQYKVGHSDFTLTGKITNIRRALTSRKGRQALRLDFELASDTVDINQLASAVFAGAAYQQRRAAGAPAPAALTLADDLPDAPEESVAADTATGPVLIPANIDARLNLRANNILYSDLMLHDLRGEALVYNGRLNFHNLRATSDMGDVDLSALYSAPSAADMQFGFGLVLRGFNIKRFLSLVPAIDSIMPLMRDISGIIDANIAATVNVQPNMDLDLPSLNAAVRLEGDSLRLMDGKTYRTMAKWLMFKDKKNDIIDSLSVEMLIDKGMLELFPFVLKLDRYRLGVQGYNDMALNFDYHVAVLKSPLPFKFGITLKGNPDDFKVRLGKARFNERTAVQRTAIVDTTRVNLLRQIEGVFRRGVTNARIAPLRVSRPEAQTIDLAGDTLTHADSVALIREGLIPAPPEPQALPETTQRKKSKKK